VNDLLVKICSIRPRQSSQLKETRHSCVLDRSVAIHWLGWFQPDSRRNVPCSRRILQDLRTDSSTCGSSWNPRSFKRGASARPWASVLNEEAAAGHAVRATRGDVLRRTAAIWRSAGSRSPSRSITSAEQLSTLSSSRARASSTGSPRRRFGGGGVVCSTCAPRIRAHRFEVLERRIRLDLRRYWSKKSDRNVRVSGLERQEKNLTDSPRQFSGVLDEPTEPLQWRSCSDRLEGWRARRRT
jgi:hypothetical protein